MEHTAIDPRDQLVAELVALRSVVNAADACSAAIVAELESLDDGHPLGCRSAAHLLSWQAGLSTGAAKAMVTPGRSFASLPTVAAAARAGEVSMWQVRAIASVADDDTDGAGFLEIARHGTCAQLEMACRRAKRARRAGDDCDAAGRRTRRARSWWTTAGTFRLDAELDAEAGAVVATALDHATEQVPAEAAAVADDPAAARAADGLELVARSFLAQPTNEGHRTRHRVSSRCTSASPALIGGSTPDGVDPTLADMCSLGWAGVGVSDVLARRLGCDTTLQAVIRDPDGNPLALGRTRRVVSRRLRRALHTRDGRCRAPNCDATRHIVAHHIVHWADGGFTDLHNLVLVCPWHHRMIHDGSLVVRTVGDQIVIAPPGDPPPAEGRIRPLETGADPTVAVAPDPTAAMSRYDGSRIDMACFDAAFVHPRRAGP